MVSCLVKTQNQSCISKRAMFNNDDTWFMDCPYSAAFDFMYLLKAGIEIIQKKKHRKISFVVLKHEGMKGILCFTTKSWTRTLFFVKKINIPLRFTKSLDKSLKG